jgi:acetyl-CoA carboxylase biotin carboxyl carrier protein
VTLTAKDVAEITRLLEESSFDELYLELDGLKLSLRRNGAAGRASTVAPGATARANTEAAEPVTSPPAASGNSAAPIRGSAAPIRGSATAMRDARAMASGAAPPASAGPAVSPAANASPSLPASAAAGAGVADPNLHNVTSPLLGTYYRAPKPGAPPYVEVGATVEEDTIVGIIEVMKLMNTVRAGVRGRVTEILARDGNLVEYGEILLRIAKTS